MTIEEEAMKRMRAGLEAAANTLAELHRRDVTAHQVSPIGSTRAQRSKPGEYPYRETGQGADNIFAVVNEEGTSAKIGYYGAEDDSAVGPYEPTHDEPGGEHMRILVAEMDRKGIRDTYLENVGEVNRAFINASQNVRS